MNDTLHFREKSFTTKSTVSLEGVAQSQVFNVGHTAERPVPQEEAKEAEDLLEEAKVLSQKEAQTSGAEKAQVSTHLPSTSTQPISPFDYTRIATGDLNQALLCGCFLGSHMQVGRAAADPLLFMKRPPGDCASRINITLIICWRGVIGMGHSQKLPALLWRLREFWQTCPARQG